MRSPLIQLTSSPNNYRKWIIFTYFLKKYLHCKTTINSYLPIPFFKIHRNLVCVNFFFFHNTPSISVTSFVTYTFLSLIYQSWHDNMKKILTRLQFHQKNLPSNILWQMQLNILWQWSHQVLLSKQSFICVLKTFHRETKYVMDKAPEDCLITGFHGNRNPFREKSSCSVL